MIPNLLNGEFRKKKKRPTKIVGRCFSCDTSARLDDRYVFSTRPLGPLPIRVTHTLAFLEFLVGHALEVRQVKEQVLSGAVVNEAESLVCQSFDGSLWHCSISSLPQKIFASGTVNKNAVQ